MFWARDIRTGFVDQCDGSRSEDTSKASRRRSMPGLLCGSPIPSEGGADELSIIFTHDR